MEVEESTITMKRTNASLMAFIGVLAMTICMFVICILVVYLDHKSQEFYCESKNYKEENDVTFEPSDNTKDHLMDAGNIQDDLLETLKTGTIVTVVGPSELLQRSIIDSVTSKISKNQECQIISCRFDVDEIEVCIANYNTQLIQIHIPKNGRIVTNRLGHWQKLFSSLTTHPTVKLLLTSEVPVYQTQLFQEIGFLTETIFDFKLNRRKTISDGKMMFNTRLYLTDLEMDSIKEYHCTNKEELFHVLCKRYAQKKVAGKVEPADIFFKDFKKTIKEDISEEMQKEDKNVFVALLLLVINNNCVPNDISAKKLASQLPKIAELLNIRLPSHTNLTNCYEFLAKSYVEKSGSNYKIASYQIYRIFATFVGENILSIAMNLRRKESDIAR